jgi:hypothetical protein
MRLAKVERLLINWEVSVPAGEARVRTPGAACAA